jgi:hypothetical protein
MINVINLKCFNLLLKKLDLDLDPDPDWIRISQTCIRKQKYKNAGIRTLVQSVLIRNTA